MADQPGAEPAGQAQACVWCPHCSAELPVGAAPSQRAATAEPDELVCPSCGRRSAAEAARVASAAWTLAADRRRAVDRAAAEAATAAVMAQVAAQRRDEAEVQWRAAIADYERASRLAVGAGPPTVGAVPPEGAAAPPAPAPVAAFGVAAMLQTIGALLLVAALVTASAVLWGRMQPWQQLALLWAMVAVVGVVAGLLSARLRVIANVLAALSVASGFVVAVAAAQLSDVLAGPWYPPLVTAICGLVLVAAGRVARLRLWSVAAAALVPITAALIAVWVSSALFATAAGPGSEEGLAELRPTAAAVSLALAAAGALLALAAGMAGRRPMLAHLLGGRTPSLWVAALSLAASGFAAGLVWLASLPVLVEGGYGARVPVSAASAGLGAAMLVVDRLVGWRWLGVLAGVPLGAGVAVWLAGPPAGQPLVAVLQAVLATAVVALLLVAQWRLWPRAHRRWLLGVGLAALTATVLAAQVLVGLIATAAPLDGAAEGGPSVVDSDAPLTAIVSSGLLGLLLWWRGTVLPWQPRATTPPAPRPIWLSWAALGILAGAWLGIITQAVRSGFAEDGAPEALCLGLAALVLGNFRIVGPRVTPLVTQLILAAAILPGAVFWITAPPLAAGVPAAAPWGGDPWWRQLIVLAGVALLFWSAARAKGPFTVPVTFAAALAVGHVWVWAGMRQAPPVEAFSLSLAAGTAVVLVVALHHRGPLLRSDALPAAGGWQPPHWYSMTWLGLPLLIALLPSAFGAEASGQGALRFWVLVLVCAAAVVAGALARVVGLLLPAALALVIAVVPVILAYTATISTWIPLTIGGLLLLGVGVRFEQARFQTRKFAHWLRLLR